MVVQQTRIRGHTRRILAYVVALTSILCGGCSNCVDVQDENFEVDGYWATPNKEWAIVFDDGICVDSAFNMKLNYVLDSNDLMVSSNSISRLDTNLKVISPTVMKLQWLDDSYTVTRVDNLNNVRFYDWTAVARADKPLYTYTCTSGASDNSVLKLYSDNTYDLCIMASDGSQYTYYGKYILNGTRLDLLSNRGEDVQPFLVYDSGCATMQLDGFVASISKGVQEVIVGTCSDPITGIHYVFNDDMTAYQYIADDKSDLLEYRYAYSNGEILLTSVNTKDSSYKMYHDRQSGIVYGRAYTGDSV